MKRIWALACALSLTGCVTTSAQLNVVHRTGSSNAERLAAFDRCDFEAIREVPRALSTNIYGGYYGGYGSMSSSTTDVNTEIRVRYINRCLESAGYQVLTRPVCTTQADLASTRATYDSQPPAHQVKCALPTRS